MTVEEIEKAKREKKRKIGEAYSIKQMIQEIDEFEKRKEAEREIQRKNVKPSEDEQPDTPEK